MAWPNRQQSAGSGSAFAKQSEYNSDRSSSSPGPESPATFPSRPGNYPASHAEPVKGLGNESNGKQGPIDMGASSHAGAYGMMRLKNRVMEMAADDAKVARGGGARMSISSIKL